jgi:hypothetical protein
VKTIKWEVFEGLDMPCADISYQWISERNAKMIVLMHFSRVVGGLDKDIELTFSQPIALQWEDETYGLIELPIDRDGHLKIPHLWPGQNTPATG